MCDRHQLLRGRVCCAWDACIELGKTHKSLTHPDRGTDRCRWLLAAVGCRPRAIHSPGGGTRRPRPRQPSAVDDDVGGGGTTITLKIRLTPLRRPRGRRYRFPIKERILCQNAPRCPFAMAGDGWCGVGAVSRLICTHCLRFELHIYVSACVRVNGPRDRCGAMRAMPASWSRNAHSGCEMRFSCTRPPLRGCVVRRLHAPPCVRFLRSATVWLQCVSLCGRGGTRC